MLYSLAKLMMRIALRIFYKRIFVTGTESIPKKGPLIFVCNHPSSMMDAALLGVLLERKIHFFTRGDIFSNPIAAKMLSALHMIPVFHHETGKESINQNDSAFAKAENILRRGGAVVFFSEGISHTDRRLLPLKKGAFRLALNIMYENPDTDVLLIPAGLNYAHPLKSGTEVAVNFSSPVALRPYVTQYQLRPAGSVLQLSRHCYTLLRKVVLHVEEPENDLLADRCLTISRSEYTFFSRGFLQATSRKFEEEKNICEVINATGTTALNELDQAMTRYFGKLKTYYLTDYLVADASGKQRFWKAAVLYTGYPILAIAYLLNALPLLIARRITIRKVKRPDFYAWVLVVSSAIFYIIWIILLFAGFAINGIGIAFVIVLLTLLTGAFAAVYLPALEQLHAANRLVRFRRDNPGLFAQLLEERSYLSQCIRSWKQLQ